MLRIKYTKSRGSIKSQLFPISDKLMPYIYINNRFEVFIKNADITIYYELCTSLRNAKYCARKFIEKLGYPLLTEMRKKNDKAITR
jgi:hypothetical protein